MSEQNYQNHTRWNPLVHFVISPLLLALLVWAIVCLIMEFEWFRLQIMLLTVVLLLVSLAARLQALRVQDRLIRLEERLRYKAVLTPELAQKTFKLRTYQIIALRFAPDEELPHLIEKVLAGDLGSSKEIKMAIKDWRADHLRV